MGSESPEDGSALLFLSPLRTSSKIDPAGSSASPRPRVDHRVAERRRGELVLDELRRPRPVRLRDAGEVGPGPERKGGRLSAVRTTPPGRSTVEGHAQTPSPPTGPWWFLPRGWTRRVGPLYDHRVHPSRHGCRCRVGYMVAVSEETTIHRPGRCGDVGRSRGQIRGRSFVPSGPLGLCLLEPSVPGPGDGRRNLVERVEEGG